MEKGHFCFFKLLDLGKVQALNLTLIVENLLLKQSLELLTFLLRPLVSKLDLKLLRDESVDSPVV